MNITFIGGGNMAGAIVGGLLAKGYAAPDLRIVDVEAHARARIAQKYPGVETFAAADSALRPDDVIVLAVKPQHLRVAVAPIAQRSHDHLVISIAAGITLPTLARWLGGHTRLIRAMPNTPALIGSGMTGLYADPLVSADDRSSAEGILGAVGATIWVDDAEHMDAVTAISGSGPAYVFYFMESLERAAQELGFNADAARELVLQTFSGAAQLALSSSESIGVLRQQVTSKGGTTEAALVSLEAAGVQAAIVRAANAAAERGRVLGIELAGEQ
jgi:pyrroline-5-carboxylate reductase